MMKLKKKREKVKLAIPVNRPMNFLKFNNMYFFQKYIFNCMIKRKIDNYIIVFNYKKKVPC